MAVATLTGCSASAGGSSRSGQPSSAGNSVPIGTGVPVLACAKITTAEVATTLGGPVTVTSPASDRCIYEGSGAAAGEAFSVVRLPATSDDPVQFPKDMAATSSSTQRVAHLNIGKGALMFKQATSFGGTTYPVAGGRCLVLLEGAPGHLGSWVTSAANLTLVSALVVKAMRLCDGS
jgi:hypothetical protein